MDAPDLYKILKVKCDATPDEITAAYRKLALKWHPDRNPGDAKAAEKFKDVKDAYDVLIDPERRARYDATGDTSTGDRRQADELFQVLHRALVDAVAGATMSGVPIEDADVIGHMTAAIAGEEQALSKTLLGMFVAQSTWKATLDRFTVEGGGENLLRDMARNEVANVEKRIAGVEARVALLDRAKAYLKTVKYRCDNPFSGKMDGWNCSTNLKGLDGMFTKFFAPGRAG